MLSLIQYQVFMGLYFIISRQEKEEHYKLKDGLIIGRSEGDIKLNDPTTSSKHAILTKTPTGWLLSDQGSRNGILYQGRRVRTIDVDKGVNFMIGKVYFKTVVIEDTVATNVDTHVNTQANTQANTKVEVTWSEKLQKMAQSVASQVRPEKREIFAFLPAVKLKFVTGIQCDTEWTIGYGPRRFGIESSEFPIFEIGAPPICFSLFHGPTSGISFITEFPDKVLLNGQAVKSGLIKAGDEITIENTVIQVDFVL